MRAEVTGRELLLGLGCAVFVLLAVGLEVVSGQGANSPSGAALEGFVPLSWPAPVRVLWWLLVGAAAAAYRLLLHRGPGARRWLAALLAAVPFVVFAGGIAVGAGWATWH